MFLKTSILKTRSNSEKLNICPDMWRQNGNAPEKHKRWTYQTLCKFFAVKWEFSKMGI